MYSGGAELKFWFDNSVGFTLPWRGGSVPQVQFGSAFAGVGREVRFHSSSSVKFSLRGGLVLGEGESRFNKFGRGTVCLDSAMHIWPNYQVHQSCNISTYLTGPCTRTKSWPGREGNIDSPTSYHGKVDKGLQCRTILHKHDKHRTLDFQKIRWFPEDLLLERRFEQHCDMQGCAAALKTCTRPSQSQDAPISNSVD